MFRHGFNDRKSPLCKAHLKRMQVKVPPGKMMHKDFARDSMQTFGNRMLPWIHLRSFFQVDQSIEQILQIIAAVCEFVSHISKRAPSKIDLAFATGATQIHVHRTSDLEDSDEDSVDEACDIDCVGNILDKLRSNNLPFIKKTLCSTYGHWKQLYHEFKQKYYIIERYEGSYLKISGWLRWLM